MKNALYVFLISLLPFIELRGAVPVGAALDLPFYLNYLVAVVGNMLPVPFILLFIPYILDFLARFRLLRPIVEWVRRKADKNRDKIIKDGSGDGSAEGFGGEARMSRGVFLALLLFVAIPLPGTGAWTGSLVAALFNLPKRQSCLAVGLGVMLCGIIMCLASYGALGFLSFLL